MKTPITVVWCSTVNIDVDPARLSDETYISAVRGSAITEAAQHVDLQNGIVEECENFPELEE